MKTTADSSAMISPEGLAPFKKLLLKSCGHRFEKEREQTLSAGLCQRMAKRGVKAHDAYHDLLMRDQEELLRLTELLTVNETYFFREPDHLNLMIDALLPELMALRNRRPIRILSAGCSTGEEPYTVAIMLRERFGAACEQRFAISGVDIDPSAITAAQQGIYGKNSFRGIDKPLVERYFEPHGTGKYLISESIRNLVAFEAANLLDDTRLQKMQQADIILYRNVSIYFPQDIQREIFGRLAGLLADDGCLLVGAAETMHHDIGILSLAQQNSLFFFRKCPAIVYEERRTVSRQSLPTQARSTPRQAESQRAVATESRREKAGTGHTEHARPPSGSAMAGDVRARFDRAVELAHTRQHEKALAILDGIIEQDAAFVKAHCLKASLLITLSRFDEADKVCTDVLGRDSLCLEAYLMLGIIARQKGSNDDAVKRFRETIYLNSACWPAHFFTAEILYARKDAKRAQSSFEAALRILEQGEPKARGQEFFPLSFNAEQFTIICRHKLSLLKENR